jgi:diguanylate cyclase (GGDEF)-like protein
MLLISARSGESSQRGAMRWVMIGMTINLFGDVIYGWQTLHKIFQSGGYLEVSWPVGWMLVGLCVRERQLEPIEHSSDVKVKETNDALSPLPSFWRMALPYFLVPAVGGLVLVVATQRGDLSLARGVYIGAAVLVGLIIARQMCSLLENRRLLLLVKQINAEMATKNRCLEDMNFELDRKNHQTEEYMKCLAEINAELTEIHTELLENNAALSRANERLAEMAARDSMTGLANHHTFQEQLRERIALPHSDQPPVTLLLFDVDGFKQYNDTYGHPAGDMVLSTLGALLKEMVRAEDLPARYGGEEFALLLDNTDLETARSFSERLLDTVASYPFAYRQITVSIGVAQYPTDAQDASSLLRSADAALYAAKNSGRNRIVLASEYVMAAGSVEPITPPGLRLMTCTEEQKAA